MEEEKVEGVAGWQPVLLGESAGKGRRGQFQVGEAVLKVLEQQLAQSINGNDDEEATMVRISNLTAICGDDKFLEAVRSTVIQWSSKRDKHELLGKLLELLLHFCAEVLERIPFLGKDVLLNLICLCVGVTAGSTSVQKTYPDLLGQFTALQKKIEEINKLFEVNKKKKDYDLDDWHYLEPPEDFRELTIIPTLEELIHERHAFLRPNRVIGDYRSSEHYLDVQFRLLREDFVQPLRLGVQDFMKNREEFIRTRGRRRQNQEQDGSVRLYNDVTFYYSEKSCTNPNDKEYIFNLPSGLVRRVNWNKSKRLLAGCLVMLTSDYCKTAIFAVTVAPPFDDKRKTSQDRSVDPRRRELSEGLLRLSIETGEELVDRKKSYLMFECEAYLEAYRHNLKILQTLDFLEKDGPLQRIFVNAASSEIQAPSYWRVQDGMGNANEMKLELVLPETRQRLLLDPISSQSWPSEVLQSEMSLDPDQYNAWTTALTSELAVIQGPPGTGKTYVGLQIVKTLLENKQRQNLSRSPMMVLCYTNHALDQFLELILKAMPRVKVVRVGGQSKSDIVKDHSLPEHRRNLRYRGASRYSMYVQNQKMLETEALNEVTRLEELLEALKAEILQLSKPDGIFHWKHMEVGRLLRKVLPGHLWNVITKDCDWLELRPDNFRMEFPVSEIVKHFFVVKSKFESVAKMARKVCVDKVEMKKPSEAHEEAIVEDDQEEHDMNEVLANRLEEDCFEEYWKNRTLRVARCERPVYMPKCSVRHCRSLISGQIETLDVCRSQYNRLIEELDYTSTSVSKAYELVERIEVLRREIVENENRANLFSAIFGLYNEDRLQMPNLEKVFFKMDNGEQFVVTTQNVERLPIRLRWAIYFKIVEIARQLGKEYQEEVEGQLEEARRVYTKQRNTLDGYILRDAEIIGMTTTGAAKMHELLDMAKPEIVVVEEAAEILEAHIVTALTGHCKHLILIGDHQQLQPSTTVWKLATKFRLNVSLFERLIMNEVSFCTLKTQHRMRPEISNLIIGPIYEDLQNHAKVYKYPKVNGIIKSLFFITHQEREAEDADLLSKSNYHEASFLVALCVYLLKQGYQPEQITILATYMGQMFQLRKLLPEFCRGVRITCVDNFQGEENDIILLSLVRSNDRDEVGFVKKDNRICVALSRARHGLYVVGNIDGMIKSSRTWRKIQQKLKDGGDIDTELELICERHGKVTKVNNGQDFKPLVYGGCDQICGAVLNCTHACPRLCHARDQNHAEFQCKQRCLKKCSLDHQCEDVCSAKCPPCPVMVSKPLECGHDKVIACFKDPSEELCYIPVMKAFDCEHELEVACHQDMQELDCMVLLEKVLNCGHVRMVECHLDPEEVRCDVKEEKTLPCTHSHLLKCYQSIDTVECNVIVEKELRCGHFRKQKCFMSVLGVKCNVEVEKELSCGHSKTLKCHQDLNIVQCKVEVEVIIPGCLHLEKLLCFQTHSPVCTNKCEKVLSCGHKCESLCHFKDDPNHVHYVCRNKCARSCEAGHPCKYKHPCFIKCLPCEIPVDVKLECGHEVSVACAKRTEDHKCYQRVSKGLPCGHEQLVLCHMNPDEHQCTVQITDCKTTCSLGHPCAFEHACYEGCPPCGEKMEKLLPSCGHEALLECHDTGTKYKCAVLTKRKLPCGHSRDLKCSIVPSRADCTELVPMKCKICRREVNISCSKEEKGICDNCIANETKKRITHYRNIGAPSGGRGWRGGGGGRGGRGGRRGRGGGVMSRW